MNMNDYIVKMHGDVSDNYVGVFCGIVVVVGASVLPKVLDWVLAFVIALEIGATCSFRYPLAARESSHKHLTSWLRCPRRLLPLSSPPPPPHFSVSLLSGPTLLARAIISRKIKRTQNSGRAVFWRA